MESGDDGLESEANVRPRPCLTGAGSPGAQSTATDRGPSRQARLNRSAEGARTAYSARHTCPKTPETQSRNRSVRQAASRESGEEWFSPDIANRRRISYLGARGGARLAVQTMTNSVTSAPEASSIEPPSRRDFLYLATASAGAVGAAATLWPFIDQMNPDASTVAAGGPIDIDLKQIEPGQQIVVLWSARPVFIANRTKPLLDVLQDPKLVARLSDPDSANLQQPAYAVNWHR